MKKWFNTNYHYIVPEVEDDTEIKLVGTKPYNEYEEAKKIGVNTKSVITGPFTLLKLVKLVGNKNIKDFTGQIIKAYEDYLKKLNQVGAAWVQSYGTRCLKRYSMKNYG